ncbi:MAG: MBL fold metallo-hydrolase [Spirochaetia bacterium]|jgi:phosphoribosyl 1,2-cyclic phosphate phosphodiesterase|nr:MBL fold metallo-hydrolase [Spirochaetia bacterium]
MKIQYLGTAAAEGIPAVFCNCDLCRKARIAGGKNLRTRSQALIDGKLLIDYPPDSYTHMQSYKLNFATISSIIVTHSHQDHFYPWDFIFRSSPYGFNYAGKLTVYGNDKVTKKGQELIAQHFLQDKNAVEFQYLEPFKPFEVEGITVTALLATHDPNEHCYIYLLEKEGKRLVYAHDTGFFPEVTFSYLYGKHCNLLSLDCTMGRLNDGHYHMGLSDDISLVEKLTDMGCCCSDTTVVLNHFSHNGGLLYEELNQLVASRGYTVAYDGLEIEV